MKNTLTSFGQELTRLLDDKGVSLYRLSKNASISYNSFYQMLHKTKNINPRTLHMISKTLELTKEETKKLAEKANIKSKYEHSPEQNNGSDNQPDSQSNNLFDLQNISDLPNELVTAIQHDRLGKLGKIILRLFDIKPILTLNEIAVALYRLEKVVKQKGNLNSSLKILVDRALIKKCGYSTYQINK